MTIECGKFIAILAVNVLFFRAIMDKYDENKKGN